jgi:hypothetical protein
MVRFFCDRCNTEVEGPDDLIEVATESRERPSLSGWSSRTEMCRACFDGVKEALIALFGPNDEAKRKPVRRASA